MEQVEYANEIIGNNIPPNYLPSCEKGFLEATNSGGLIGYPVEVPRHAPANLPYQKLIGTHLWGLLGPAFLSMSAYYVSLLKLQFLVRGPSRPICCDCVVVLLPLDPEL